MEHDPHTGFIVAAYLIAFAVVAAMIVVILVDYRTLKRQLRRFGAKGEDGRGGTRP